MSTVLAAFFHKFSRSKSPLVRRCVESNAGRRESSSFVGKLAANVTIYRDWHEPEWHFGIREEEIP